MSLCGEWKEAGLNSTETVVIVFNTQQDKSLQ